MAQNPPEGASIDPLPLDSASARSRAPIAARKPRRLLVITGGTSSVPVGPIARKGGPTPQLRDAMAAAVSAARRVRR